MVMSDEEESELLDTADSAAAKRRAALALFFPTARAMAHKEELARHLVEYAKEEQHRHKCRAERQGATKRFKLFDCTKREEKEALAKVATEVIVLSDDDE